MKGCSIFRSGHFLFLLCLFAVEGKKSPTGKHTCRKGLLSQVTENLYVKATSLKSSVPKDLIKTTRLLKKTTKMLFMTNCSVRDQLLSFYVKNVFSRLELVSFLMPLSSQQLGDQGFYKAIHELDILLPWIQAYIQTII
ncbi:Interleukin-26 [Lonchura striata]|uniref:Interleukin-26 n=1 Tax=Lonchura striata TaxID=40157 RepID=A0A218V3Y8_9PASE|nr:Interleukin-26 [Lonchura striata domestica]